MDEVATEMKKSRSKSTPAPTSERFTRSKPERSTNEEPKNQDAHEVPGGENLSVTSDRLTGKGAEEGIFIC